MPKLNWKRYLSAFRSLKGAAAGIGTVVPSLSFLTTLAPPLLAGTGPITTALSAAAVVVGFYLFPAQSSDPNLMPSLVRKAAKFLLAFVLLLFVIYPVLVGYCTVMGPPNKTRYQIGFGRTNWTLNEDGLKLKARYPSETPTDWMLRANTFSRLVGPGCSGSRGQYISRELR